MNYQLVTGTRILYSGTRASVPINHVIVSLLSITVVLFLMWNYSHSTCNYCSFKVIKIAYY